MHLIKYLYQKIPYKRTFIFCFFLKFTQTLISFAIPQLTKYISEKIESHSLLWTEVKVLFPLVFFIILLDYTSEAYAGYQLNNLSHAYIANERIRLLSLLQKQSPKYFMKNTVGSVINKFTGDLSMLSDFLNSAYLLFFDGIFTLIVLLGLLLYSFPLYFVLIILSPYIIGFFFFRKGIDLSYVYYDQFQDQKDSLYTKTLEDVRGLRLIKAYQQENWFTKHFQDKSKKTREFFWKLRLANILGWNGSNLAYCFTLIFSLFLTSYEMSQGRMGLAHFIYLSLLISQINFPIILISEIGVMYKNTQKSYERLQELEKDALEQQEEELPALKPSQVTRFKEKNGQNVQEEKPVILEVKNLSFRYPGTEHLALNKLSFRLRAGETLGIVGPIGAGKTTLLRLLQKQYENYEGEIYLYGQSYHEHSASSIRQCFTYTPQQVSVFSRSIRNNLRFSQVEEEHFEKSLEAAAFLEESKKLPQGLETVIGEYGVTLSGGQKQRLSLARALCRQDSILLLDDTLSAVDHVTEKHILENLEAQRAKDSKIIVAHRFSAIENADYILVLENGHLIQQGRHKDLIQVEGWYAEQYKFQQASQEALEGGLMYDEAQN